MPLPPLQPKKYIFNHVRIFRITEKIVITKSKFPPRLFTCQLAAHVVLFADELVFLKDVEFLAGGELLPAHAAGEALEVEDAITGLPHQVLRRDALQTPRALGPEPPAGGDTRGA